ncbi:MAG: hypothetical protein HY260_12700, partial [Chloroflexi bacterium]|nr:hypothetical protein [Chloroflexota bacterium]
SGQMDIFILGLWALVGRGSALALALMTLKPQLALLVVPWTLWAWRRERRRLLAFGLWVAALYAAPALFHPNWTREWLTHRLFGYPAYAREAFPTLVMLTELGAWAAPLYLGAAALAVWWSWPRDREIVKVVGLLVSPVLRPYNYALIAGPSRLWRTVLAGWAAWLVFLVWADTHAYVLLPLVVLWEIGKMDGSSANMPKATRKTNVPT